MGIVKFSICLNIPSKYIKDYCFCYCGYIFRKINGTRKTPTRKISTQDNSHPDNSYLGNSHPENSHLDYSNPENSV